MNGASSFKRWRIVGNNLSKTGVQRNPRLGMVADAAGNSYSVTVYGGVDGEGAIYQFTPNEKSRDDMNRLRLRVSDR